MKTKILIFVSFFLFLNAEIYAQNVTRENVINTLKKVADNVVKQSTYLYYNRSTGEMINDIQKYGYNRNIQPQSDLNKWVYSNGVIHMAFNSLSELIDDEKYKNYTRKNFEFFFNDFEYFKSIYNGQRLWSFPLGQAIVIEELDHCGAMGASLIELYERDKNKVYKTYIDRTANHIMNVQMRLDDGTLSRSFPEHNTVWADDLYMSVPFLVRMGNLTGDKKYFDEAVKQVVLFNNHLFIDNKGLMMHCYYGDLQTNGGSFWGRCNGWTMVAMADLLKLLPETHEQRDTVISLLTRNIQAVAQYQSQNGLWHQLLDKSDSYQETSCSAMFTYSVALAINQGWLDERYKNIALAGWEGIETQITGDGGINNICVGTGIGNELKFYYERPVAFNDIHGIGAVILAGIEVSKLFK
jgi:unsaturated rhamnogalacturonyl hydrolase